MDKITFAKMSGSGNDFIIVDNRSSVVGNVDLKPFIVNVCRRKLSVGADGFILIENSDVADFKWHFYNSDGSRPEMCGNGARCAARFAFLKGIAGSELAFETDAGIISAEIVGKRVKVGMPDPSEILLDVKIDLSKGPCTASSLNTGVPHVIVEEKVLEDIDVFHRGREIRNHSAFAPDGTNVNFVSIDQPNRISIRTYERGVEDETLACGTGAIAAALAAAAKNSWQSPIHVHTRGGVALTIHFTFNNGKYRNVYLEGDARIIYEGKLWEEAWS